MSDRPLLFIAFDGVTLHNGTTQKQVAPYDLDGDQAITRLFRLSNGAWFDADGTADGVTTYGQIQFTLRITAATHAAANTAMLAITALLNRHGPLTGNEYGASAATQKVCTARCIVARPIPRVGMAMVAGRRYQVDVEMVFQRFTAFS